MLPPFPLKLPIPQYTLTLVGKRVTAEASTTVDSNSSEIIVAMKLYGDAGGMFRRRNAVQGTNGYWCELADKSRIPVP